MEVWHDDSQKVERKLSWEIYKGKRLPWWVCAAAGIVLGLVMVEFYKAW